MSGVHANSSRGFRRATTVRATAEVNTRRWDREDRRVLALSVATALGLWCLAGLNASGLWSFELRPGEGAGWNPAFDFAVLGLVTILLPYGVARRVHLARVDALERSLPEFLEDVAESGRHGLTLADAIAASARGQYGALTPEVRRLASEVAWGIPVDEALAGFAERVPTPLVRQAMTIVLRSQATGGRYPEVLERVARDARAAQLVRDQRRDVMRTYLLVVGLAYAVFLLTVYVLASVFLPDLVTASSGTASVAIGTLVGVPVVASLFLALFAAVVAHGVGDGIVAGLLYRGRLADGMAISAALLLVGWVVMRFAIAPIGGGG